MRKDLISIKTRQVFRERMVRWVLNEIRDAFDAAGITCDLNHTPTTTGQRRGLVEQYYHAVDWSDGPGVRKVLDVFESVLFETERLARDKANAWNKEHQADLDKMLWTLKKDGFEWRDGAIVVSTESVVLNNIKHTAQEFSATYMAEQILRMETAVGTDPALAIGTAKELIETCCKTILTERSIPMTGKEDIPKLTKAVAKELRLVPEGVPDEARGRDVVKRILQSLGAIGNDLAELRGLYGTGHGKDGRAKGLTPRHARLAVGAAATLVRFLFDTHREMLR